MAAVAATVVIATGLNLGNKFSRLYAEQIAGRDWMEDYLTPQQSTK